MLDGIIKKLAIILALCGGIACVIYFTDIGAILKGEAEEKEKQKAEAKAKKEDLISRGLCLKCGEYIKHDERNMNYRGYCPTC